MHHHTAHASTAGAIALVALLGVVAACLAVGVGRRWAVILAVGAGAGALFQLGHFAEHVAQAGYWVAHRGDAPWMTPWANALADSFQRIAPGAPGFGMEALHLVGNTIFLAGAVAILAVVTRDAPVQSHRPARLGVWVQTAHVVEHVALTVSVLLAERAIGVSTLFGGLDPGPWLWTYRIWWHLAINATATLLLVTATIRWRRQRASDAPLPAAPALAV
jgi:hypothetical protein